MNFLATLIKQLTSQRTVEPVETVQTRRQEIETRSAYEGSVDVLKQLIPIGSLEERELRELNILALDYSPGAIIFNRGEAAESMLYLLSGEVYLETAGKQNLVIEAGTFEALYPLSCGEYRNATAICKKNAVVIAVPKVAMDLYRHRVSPNRLLELPEQYRDNRLLNRFIDSDNIVLPALPDVAVKLRQAMQNDIGVAEIVKIVKLDPAISAKLIQVANSPIYRTVNPITTCLNAVNRIGLHSTKNIVTSISLRSLYKKRRQELNVLAQTYWKRSIRISALSYTLANQTGCCDPEEALLAGLTANIGVVPFLKFADNLSDELYDVGEVMAALPFVSSALSALVLAKWDFPDNMTNIPLETQTWFMVEQDRSDANLTDIVLLAKYHAQLGTGKNRLPPITSLPSFAYLKNAELSPDKSLKILQDAKQQVAEAMRFFSP